jgi:transglutaminase-like putative cysteine protease
LEESALQLIQASQNINDYLRKTEILDYDHPLIADTAMWLFHPGQPNVAKVKVAFEFVRDAVRHSWDVQHTRVTCKASDVLRWREGICYAKSHLLAALLRSQHIPTGFCYQRLMLFDTPEKGYCIHALNTVFIEEKQRWIRLDARGNKPGIATQFSLDHEVLAFSIQMSLGEIDYPTNFSEPHPSTVATLLENDNALTMYRYHLPDRI